MVHHGRRNHWRISQRISQRFTQVRAELLGGAHLCTARRVVELPGGLRQKSKKGDFGDDKDEASEMKLNLLTSMISKSKCKNRSAGLFGSSLCVGCDSI